MASETEVVAALKAAFAPTQVYWGWAPFESVEASPSLPIITVRRAMFSTAGYETMCEDEPIQGDTTLLVHVWSDVYEVARAMCTLARETLQDAGGWVLQSESDSYEPNFRAWQIEGQWMAGGVAPE
jgi:hypothetical protein